MSKHRKIGVTAVTTVTERQICTETNLSYGGDRGICGRQIPHSRNQEAWHPIPVESKVLGFRRTCSRGGQVAELPGYREHGIGA